MDESETGSPVADTSTDTDANVPWYKLMGPGLITGAADDDPSGIVTYAQAGAQFGNGLLWSVLLTLPLMIAIQLVCARLGRISGRGIVANIRRHQSRPLAYAFVVLLVVANTLNVGADLAAMGDALALVLGGARWIYTLALAAGSLLLQLFMPYRRYAAYLKWLSLSLLVYIAAMFLLKIDWHAAALAMVWPRIEFSSAYLLMVVAVLGTTISPYLFVWQAAAEVEELDIDRTALPLHAAPEQARMNFRRINVDTVTGMVVSAVIALCIMLTTSYALHNSGILDIDSSAAAAKALEPVAGKWALLLFSAGIIGTGLMAVPVLAGSVGYAVAEAMRWRRSLEEKPLSARNFYAVIGITMVIGTALCWLPIEPAKMLVWSAVLNGIAAAPAMVMLQLMSRHKAVVGEFRTPGWVHSLAWLATATMWISLLVTIVFAL
ncbi:MULTISPECIES: Nramp family divalent metal transporter [Cupriavidus]|uniref:Natural resistance-associated macrophage protein n=1 Tax=Cupriavidus pinatubonensis (strain JMP 134 / LMG 1197) TaxID=264198 RepID=Q471I6_CUPPJ|nr:MULTISPECIES: Nramp family divalent metal transporter [Cupriavidus]QYY33132.1 Nramp family divalent metal transporter [Cupriavidus pinatubonensis]